MGGVVDFVSDIFTGGDDDVADAPKEAAEIQAKYQREALDYLKEREAIPQQFREGALTQLGGLYGLEGGEGDQQALIEQAIASPLYQAMMGGQKMGEEAIMRHAGMTGGLRSGDVQGAMYDYNTQLQNQALLQSYNQQLQGLQGLAGLPSNVSQIAAQTGAIGQTLAQGDIASAQAQQMQKQQSAGNIMGLGQLGLAAYGMFSDRRIKKNIKLIGKVNGYNFYTFKWNKIGKALGLDGETCGCMADEVFQKNPEAVSLKDGFMFVNYSAIGVL